MGTDIKSSSTATTATHIGNTSRAAKEITAQAKAMTRVGGRGDTDDAKTEDPSNEMAMLALEQGRDGGGLPPNGTFSLWQMLMAIMKYEKTNLDNNAEMQKNYATVLGGLDGQQGVFSELYNVGCEVGKQDAQSMMDDAYGKFAQAGISGLSVATSAIKFHGPDNRLTGESTSTGIARGNAITKNASDMESAINKSPAAVRVGEKLDAAPSVNKNVQARVDGWADGSRSLDNFDGGLNEDGTANKAEADLNKAAAEHVANDPAKRAQIQKKIDKQRDSGSSQINNADQKFNTFQNLNSTVTQGLNNTASGISSTKQADAIQAKAKASAEQTIISQAQQGLSTSENTAEKNAQDALQQANQWAAGFASAASSQVHA